MNQPEEDMPSMLLQLALRHVDCIADDHFVEVSDETARRKGNPYAKRKVHMGDARNHAKHAAAHLRKAWDQLEWTEKWREEAIKRAKEAAALRATVKIAIGHLHAVVNMARTHAEQQAADTAARDWLASIGSEPQ